MRGVVFVAMALGCGGSKSSAIPDAASEPDSAADAAVDSAVIPPDVEIDSPPPDAPAPSQCTAPTTLVDVAPRRLVNFVVSGTTLYASAFAVENQTVTDATVFSIDLTTGAADPTPLTTTKPSVLYAAGDDVLAVDGAGTITRLHPGEQPTVLITGRVNPRAATIDDGFLYWTEESPTLGQPDLVRRRLLAGGAIQEVMTCEGSLRLLVVGTELYCSGRRLEHAPKIGGGPTTQVANSANGFFIPALIEDAGTIYFANSEGNHPTLFVVQAGDTATQINQLTVFDRYTGIAPAPGLLYLVAEDTGLWRVDRTTHVAENIINTVLFSGTPTRAGGELYIQSATLTSSGEPLIVHCLE